MQSACSPALLLCCWPQGCFAALSGAFDFAMPTSVSCASKKTKEPTSERTDPLSHLLLSVCAVLRGLVWPRVVCQFLCSVCHEWKVARQKHGHKCNDCHHEQQRHPADAPAAVAPPPPPLFPSHAGNHAPLPVVQRA